MQVSGHPSVAPHLSKMYGVLNGIDVEIWDPSEDSFLPMVGAFGLGLTGVLPPAPSSCRHQLTGG